MSGVLRAGLRRLLPGLLFSLAAVTCAAQQPVAEVSRLVGTATAQSPGAERRALSQGAAIYLLDRVETGPRAALRLQFRDQTSVSLGERSGMIVSRYSADAAEPSFLAEILRGTFRIVTGLIGRTRPTAVSVITPTAVVGVRGTHFGGEVDGERTVVVLLEPEQRDTPTAVEVSNRFGRVVLEEPGFGTEIPNAQSAPSVPRRMQLRAVENLIRSVTTIQRSPAPRAPR